MLRIRVKMGPPRNKEWTCCFGLHVRTATIMIGLWHLFLNAFALGILAAIIRNPAMMQELESGYDDYSKMMEPDAPALPTPLSKIDPPFAYRDHSLNYHNVDMGGIVCVCMISISLMLIYGAAKYKPSHLLPFFCLQLFDFAITTLTAAGYLCYLRSVHRIIAESHRLPWRDELLKMSPQRLSFVVLFVFVTIVLIKAYAIGIVWRCYKYLTIRQHNLRSMLPYIIPDMTARQERDYNTLLPDYEEAIAQSMKQPPPPSYQVATANAAPQTSLHVNLTNPASTLNETTNELDTATPPPSFAIAVSANSSVAGSDDTDNANTTPALVSADGAVNSATASPSSNVGQPTNDINQSRGSFGSHTLTVKPYYSY